MEFAAVGGVRLGFERVGSGRPVVLSGGMGMPPATWELSGLRGALVDAGFEVVTYAARGVAPSDAPPAPYTVADLAGDLAGLMDHLGIEDAAVVGYSLGACTAELLARTRPELVSSLVLMAGTGPLGGVMEAVVAAEDELVRLLGYVPPAYMRLQTLLTTPPPSVLRDEDQVRVWLELLGGQEAAWTSREGETGQVEASRDWLRDPGRMAALPRITAPALVLAFEHDLYFPPHTVRVAAEALPRGEFVRIDAAAHGGLLTHPKETIDTLLRFLTAH
jgi:pimeloyl-ACP methyl ester carboxylesterase